MVGGERNLHRCQDSGMKDVAQVINKERDNKEVKSDTCVLSSGPT